MRDCCGNEKDGMDKDGIILDRGGFEIGRIEKDGIDLFLKSVKLKMIVLEIEQEIKKQNLVMEL